MAVYTPISDIEELSLDVRKLLLDRAEARNKKDYVQSDKIRDQIKDLGYLVNDLPRGKAGKPYGTEILKIGDDDVVPTNKFLLLFGSGEIAPSSVDIYRQTFLKLGKRNLKISLITTPAGFQPNVEHVYTEIKDFLLASLPDFNLNLNIIFANTKEDANNPNLVALLEGSDIIFTGPGSPTYAVKHLKDTLLLNKIVEMVKGNTSLILASAATITFSRYALPVYEIFKVGQELHWIDGLDLFSQLWQEFSIIPHFNNREGGEDLDTTYCYIGKSRAEKMLKLLPQGTPVLGIDEHTCLIVDLNSKEQTVRGKGEVKKI